MDSLAIAEGNEADNDGNEDEDCIDDDKPEDEGRSHNIINTTYRTALYTHSSTHTQPPSPPPHTHTLPAPKSSAWLNEQRSRLPEH